MDCNGKLHEKIAADIRSYVQMEIDSAKLAAVEGMSTVIGKGIGLIIFLFLANTALLLLIGAATYGLGLLIGSMVWAAVIMGVVCFLAGYWVFRRPGIFVNRMVPIFTRIFFCPRKND